MEWLIGFSTAVILAFVGYWLTQQQRKSEKRDEQIEAVAALRFELQSNLGWIDGILESHNYLRDEAWVTLKNKGYISYLPSPIPMKVISVYDKTHRLNEQIRVLREETQNFNAEKAEQDRTALRTEIIELIAMLDIKYPKIGRNFRGWTIENQWNIEPNAAQQPLAPDSLRSGGNAAVEQRTPDSPSAPLRGEPGVRDRCPSGALLNCRIGIGKDRMTPWWFYVSFFWRLLVFVCIFVIIHYLRGLDIGITGENYKYWALPFLIWAEFGIRMLLKNEQKMIRLVEMRKTPFGVIAITFINFLLVDVLTPLVFGKVFPWLIGLAFAILLVHGQWVAFAMAASDEKWRGSWDTIGAVVTAGGSFGVALRSKIKRHK
jgi:hypothetical protein